MRSAPNRSEDTPPPFPDRAALDAAELGEILEALRPRLTTLAQRYTRDPELAHDTGARAQ